MSDWRGWPRSGPKKPPPEHGIKLTKAGTTWWGQRWLEALVAVLRGDAGRLARGRTYARAGRTHDLVVHDGKVSAKVTGSRATPYDVSIELAQLDANTWTKAIAGMAEKAQFSAELLAGQMPQHIDEVFRAAGASLFPTQRRDLTTSCSCPDWGDPCKHVAATHYVLGEALDRDPFLLFELRGKRKEEVLDALRSARGPDAISGESEAEAAPRKRRKRGVREAEAAAPEGPSKVSLGKLSTADYDRPREALPALHFSFDEPVSHGAVLRQLGAPAAWSGRDTPLDVLAPLVRAAAETARRVALAETQPDATQAEAARPTALRVPRATTQLDGEKAAAPRVPETARRVTRAETPDATQAAAPRAPQTARRAARATTQLDGEKAAAPRVPETVRRVTRAETPDATQAAAPRPPETAQLEPAEQTRATEPPATAARKRKRAAKRRDK